jgi:aconitate hydratase
LPVQAFSKLNSESIQDPEQIRYTIERDGIIATFEKNGAKYLPILGYASGNGIEQERIKKRKNTVYIPSIKLFKRTDGNLAQIHLPTSPRNGCS